ncbi:MAG: hypothetical protein AB7O78_13660 [Thermoleophilia bacterium]
MVVRDGVVRVTAGRRTIDLDAGGHVVRRATHRRATPGAIGHRPSARAALVADGDGVVWTVTDDGALTGREPGSGRVVAGPFDVGADPRSLVATGGAVYVGLRHPAVVRVDPASGRTVWRRDIPYT